MLTAPAWNLPVSVVYCVLQWFLFVLPSKATIFSFYLKTLDAWTWWVMMFHVVNRYSDIFWLMVFAAFSTAILCSQQRGFNSNIDRMRTALWPNVNFKSLHEFLHCFCSFLWHMNFELWTPSDLADILFDDQYGRYFFGLFFLSM